MNEANLTRWVDELQGQIDQLRMALKMAGGGDTVTITPALESGTKVADYTIGDTEGSLFAPPTYAPPEYDDTEFDTGKTWTDGRHIYGIIVTDTIDAAASGKVIHTDTDIDEVLFMISTIKGETWELSLPFADTNYVTFKRSDGTLLRTQASNMVTDYPDLVVYMEYVKTPPVATKKTKKTKKK